ncbi:hypothetical protein ACES2L_01965 [Bdellovibrio bacteriovorus]
MKVFMAIALSTVFSVAAYAGSQKVYPVSVKKVLTTSQGLQLVGEVNSKEVRTILSKAEITGDLGSVVCEPYECSAVLVATSDRVIATVSIDQDQDGNIEVLQRRTIGLINEDGSVRLNNNVSPTLVYVEERYSVLEKISGARDRNFFALSLNLK